VRLFIGIPAPPSPQYAEVAQEIESRFHGRPVPPDSWHMTVRFLGEADPRPIQAALGKVAASQAPLPSRVAGVGAFESPRRARILWAGVHAPGLADLAQAVREAVPGDEKEFHAHVTLARLKAPRDLTTYLAEHAATVFAEGLLDRIVLYSSQLGPKGPRYEVLESFPLTAGP
jgi:RNA 2',3'-cyclic 3'-phosphodiesterase